MDLAEIAGAEAIIYHPGYEHNHHRFYREQWIEYSRRTWRPLARRAARAGMGFVLENTFERGPADVLPLLEALAGEGVGFCLDTGHVTAFSQTPMEDWAAAMHPHITALHLHDNNGDQDQHLGLGQGAIDFASLLTYLADRGVKPRTVTLEPHQPEGLAPSFHVLRCIWPDSWR
jgi:sugar phosphate isomerase/epimerase